jgi:RNA-binding protein YhbY
MENIRARDISELSSERRKELTNRALARQVVQEIMNFGVNDAIICEIIRQLAVELEDREVMLKIFEFLGSSEDQQEKKIYT